MSFTSVLSDVESQQVSDVGQSVVNVDDDSPRPLGKRAAVLRDALSKTFERCIGSIKLAEFKEHFKEIDEHYPDVLEDLHEQLISQLYSSIHTEAESICKEENVITLLNSLDATILESKNTDVKQLWRPSGNPEEDVRDHLYLVKIQHKTALENHLQDLLKKNEAFIALVERNHDEILRLSKQNESYIEEMKTAIAVTKSEEMNLMKEKIHCQLMKSCDLND